MTRNNRKFSVGLGRSRLMTMSAARSTGQTAGVQLDEPVRPQHHIVTEDGSHRNTALAEQIWNLQDLIDQSAGGPSDFQQIQLLGEKAVVDVSTTVLEVQKLRQQDLAAIPDNKSFSSTVTAGSDVLKLEK